jgi:hypothetical protein
MPRLKLTDCVWVPDVPVSFTVYCPKAAELLADRVIKLFPVVGFGEKVAVTPAGSPDNDQLTPPAKPYWGYS